MRVSDPFVEFIKVNGRRLFSEPMEKLLEWAEAVVIMVDHSIYREKLPEMALRGRFTGKVVVDTKNVLPRRLAQDFRLIRLGDGRTQIHGQ